jgi:ribonuclease HI
LDIVPSESFTRPEIQSPAGVLTAELTALFTALRQISEVLRPPEKCLILTDSLSLIRAMLSRKIAHQTYPLVDECKQLCWSLCQNGIEVKLMWTPSHVGLVENELVDDRAQQVALEGKAPSSTDNFIRAISRVWLDRR